MVSMWTFSYNLSVTLNRKSVSYNIARQSVEVIRETGFTYTTDGTQTLYYDATGAGTSSTYSAAYPFRSVVTVTSSKYSSDIYGSQVPAISCLRTVTVAITFMPTNQTTYQTGTYLVRAGV